MAIELRDDQYALSLLAGSNSDDEQYATPRSAVGAGNGAVAPYTGRPYGGGGGKQGASAAGVRVRFTLGFRMQMSNRALILDTHTL